MASDLIYLHLSDHAEKIELKCIFSKKIKDRQMIPQRDNYICQERFPDRKAQKRYAFYHK